MNTHDNYDFSIATNDVALTINIPAESLYHLVSIDSGCCFYSKDEQGIAGETVTENIKKVFAIAGLPIPSRHASCAACIGLSGEKILSYYGNVRCVLNEKKVANMIWIFNGDIKDIGIKLQGELNGSQWVCAIHGDLPNKKLRKQLEEMQINQQRAGKYPRKFPCLVGRYYEARLMRALVASDIRDIYYDTRNPDVSEKVKEFCNNSGQ